MDSEEVKPPSPAPEEGGVELVQRKPEANQVSSAIQLARNEEGLRQDSLAGTLKDILDQGIKSPASQARLLVYQVGSIESRLLKSEEEREKLQAKLDSLREEFHNKRLECEVLKAQMGAMARLKIMQQCLLTIGATSLGLFIKSIGNPANNLAVGGAIFSALLILAGWLWPIGFKSKEQQ